MRSEVLSGDKLIRTFSFEQGAFALLLVTGMYFPSSINGEHSISAILIAYAILIGLLLYMAWKFGIRREIGPIISLSIMAVLGGCGLLALMRGPVDFDLGLFVKFSALALLLMLDVQRFRPGPFVKGAFVLVNVLNIACGIAVLLGNEWMTGFIPNYYWISDSSLVPLMMSLHKPVLTFGTHSLAGLFTYLYFWINWERCRLCKSKLSFCFAIGYFILLLGLTSFTSFAFAALALGQMVSWGWRHSPRPMIVGTLCLVAITPLVVGSLTSKFDLSDLPQLVDATFLNSDLSGPVARYGANGTLRPALNYLFDHPLSPISLARSTSALDVGSSTHFFVGDSGPLEYLIRGSIPLLFLIYFGLYHFLRHNLISRTHGITLFVVIIAFEAGFSALDSSRTFFLLPFFVVYLNGIVSASGHQTIQVIVPNQAPAISF